jgi:hypothetical protein
MVVGLADPPLQLLDSKGDNTATFYFEEPAVSIPRERMGSTKGLYLVGLEVDPGSTETLKIDTVTGQVFRTNTLGGGGGMTKGRLDLDPDGHEEVLTFESSKHHHDSDSAIARLVRDNRLLHDRVERLEREVRQLVNASTEKN